MAKTVAEKLQIKPNTTVWSSDPANLRLLQPLPDGVTEVESPAEATAGLIWAHDAASAGQRFEANKEHLGKFSLLWVAYPKGNRTDINRDTLWPLLTPYGLRPVSQVALDDTWSALRFRPLAEGETFAPGAKAG